MNKRLCLLALISAPCLAVYNQLDFNFGRATPQSYIQAGGSSDRAGSRGTAWSADFLHEASPHYYLGIGGGEFRSNDNRSQTFIANTDSKISSKSTTILLLSRADIPARSRMVPYIIAGIGWAKNSLNVTKMPGLGNLLDDSTNAFAYAYGMGLDYPLSSRVVIGVEARYQGSLKQTYDLTPEGKAATGSDNIQTSMNIFFLGVKLGFTY